MRQNLGDRTRSTRCLLSNEKKTVVVCLRAAHLGKNRSKEMQFDWTIKHCYATVDVGRLWINQLKSILIGIAISCARKFYLERQFEGDPLNIIEQHYTERILEVPVTKAIITSPGNLERTDWLGHSDLRSAMKIDFFSRTWVSSLSESQETLTRSLTGHGNKSKWSTKRKVEIFELLFFSAFDDYAMVRSGDDRSRKMQGSFSTC